MSDYKFKKFESLKSTIKGYNVYFLHGLIHDIPSQTSLKQFYNDYRISLSQLMKQKPHISCRTIRYSNNLDKPWSDINALIGDGIITFANPQDVWSIRTGIKIPESDNWDLRNSILNSKGMNELHIYNPKIVGICLSIIKILDDGNVLNETIEKFNIIPKKDIFKWNGIYKPAYINYSDIKMSSEKFDIPVYGLIDGKLYLLTYKDHKFYLGKEVKPKDIK